MGGEPRVRKDVPAVSDLFHWNFGNMGGHRQTGFSRLFLSIPFLGLSPGHDRTEVKFLVASFFSF